MAAPSFALFGILLILAVLAGLGIVVFVLLSRRAPEEGGSTGSGLGRGGCVVVGVLGIAALYLLLRAAGGPTRIEGDVTVRISSPGAELFLDTQFIGTGDAAISPSSAGVDLGVEIEESQVAEHLFPGGEIVHREQGAVLSGQSRDRSFFLRTWTVLLRTPEGELDSVAILVFELSDYAGGVAERRALTLRARNDGQRVLSPGLASVQFSGRSFLDRLIRIEHPPRYEIQILTGPIPEQSRVEGEEPTFVVDRFPTRESTPR